jgi:ribonuclease HI
MQSAMTTIQSTISQSTITVQSEESTASTVSAVIIDSPSRVVTMRFDGASWGNPGPAGCGYIFFRPDHNFIGSGGRALGRQTCNVAEYNGLIDGCREALNRGFTDIRIEGDSLLVCNQVNGIWKTKAPHLERLRNTAQDILSRFHSHSLTHVSREKNRQADAKASYFAGVSQRTMMAAPALARTMRSS